MGNIPTQRPAERFGPDRAHCQNLSGACCRFPELQSEDPVEIKGKPATGENLWSSESFMYAKFKTEKHTEG